MFEHRTKNAINIYEHGYPSAMRRDIRITQQHEIQGENEVNIEVVRK